MLRFGHPILDQFASALADCRVFPLASLDGGLKETLRLLAELRSSGNKVMLVGNGGSAAIASHQATDLCRNGGLRAIAFNDASQITCFGNDFGYEDVFARAVRIHADPGDLLVAISSSGESENIVQAALAARARGASVVTFSGFRPDNRLGRLGHVNFHVPSFSYGVVETAHLLLLHVLVEGLAATREEERSDRPHRVLPKDAPHPAN